MLNRRDFLKYGAMAGGMAGVLSALGPPLSILPGPAAVASQVDQDELLVSGNFKVDIQDCPVASANVQSIQIEDIKIDVIEMPPDNDNYRQYAPGDAHYGKATIQARFVKGRKELLQWLEDAAAGKNVRKNITVTLLDRRGNPGRSYGLMDCFPISWTAMNFDTSSTVQTETLTVKVGRIEFKT